MSYSNHYLFLAEEMATKFVQNVISSAGENRYDGACNSTTLKCTL